MQALAIGGFDFATIDNEHGIFNPEVCYTTLSDHSCCPYRDWAKR
jgi:2-keto-3-deoxy-L-rhamnonate aldolase RhmA